MIKLERMTAKFPELNAIAKWRNESLISLRANEDTLQGASQVKWVESFGPSEKYFFIYDLITATSKPLVGYCGLDKIHSIHRTAELSLLIDPSRHKEGFGKQAVKELLRFGFEFLNLNCIFIEVIHSTNNWDFWLKQGFEYEGTGRARYFKNNRYCEARIGSVLKSEWTAKIKPEDIKNDTE
jgi:RimJ/RimL family protein N-acetyltransferase